MTFPQLTIERPKPDTILEGIYQGPGYPVQLQGGGHLFELTTDEARRLYTWLGLILGPALPARQRGSRE